MNLLPHIIRELNLPGHGLEIIPLEASFLPLPDGDSLCRWADPNLTRREIARFSKKDAEVYPEFGMAMMKMAYFVKRMIDMPTPDPLSNNPAEFIRLMQLGKYLYSFGPDVMYQQFSGSSRTFSRLRCRSAVSSGRFSESGRRAPLMCSYTITWERSTAPFVLGDLPRGGQVA